MLFAQSSPGVPLTDFFQCFCSVGATVVEYVIVAESPFGSVTADGRAQLLQPGILSHVQPIHNLQYYHHYVTDSSCDQ